MCKWGTNESIVIEQMVAVDACLAPLIVALNRAGIYTRNCCCGHLSGTPASVILDSRQHPGVPTAEQRAREYGLAVFYTDDGQPELRMSRDEIESWLTSRSAAQRAAHEKGTA